LVADTKTADMSELAALIDAQFHKPTYKDMGGFAVPAELVDELANRPISDKHGLPEDF